MAITSDLANLYDSGRKKTGSKASINILSIVKMMEINCSYCDRMLMVPFSVRWATVVSQLSLARNKDWKRK